VIIVRSESIARADADQRQAQEPHLSEEAGFGFKDSFLSLLTA
jgi:hypothetical protein